MNKPKKNEKKKKKRCSIVRNSEIWLVFLFVLQGSFQSITGAYCWCWSSIFILYVIWKREKFVVCTGFLVHFNFSDSILVFNSVCASWNCKYSFECYELIVITSQVSKPYYPSYLHGLNVPHNCLSNWVGISVLRRSIHVWSRQQSTWAWDNPKKRGHPSSKQTEHPFNMNPNLRSVAIWQRLADSVKIEYDKWYVPDSLLQWEIKHKFLYAKSKTKLVH